MPPIRKSSGSGDGRQNAIPASAERLQFKTQLVAILGNTQFIHGGASDTFQFSLGGPSASADMMSQKLISELEERLKGLPQADIDREFGGRVAQVIELAEKVIPPAHH